MLPIAVAIFELDFGKVYPIIQFVVFSNAEMLSLIPFAIPVGIVAPTKSANFFDGLFASIADLAATIAPAIVLFTI